MTTQPTPTPNEKHRAAARKLVSDAVNHKWEGTDAPTMKRWLEAFTETLATFFPDSAPTPFNYKDYAYKAMASDGSAPPTPVAGEGKPFADMSLDEVLKIENKTSLLIGRPAPVATQAGTEVPTPRTDVIKRKMIADLRSFLFKHTDELDLANSIEPTVQMVRQIESALTSAQATIEELHAMLNDNERVADEEIRDLRATVERLSKAQPINTHVRLFDLVRYMRSELHAAELITDEEHTWLCSEAPLATSPKGGSPSPRRLEDYDELRQKLARLEKERGDLKQSYENAFQGAESFKQRCAELAGDRDRLAGELEEAKKEVDALVASNIQIGSERDQERRMRQTMETRHGEVVTDLATLREKLRVVEEATNAILDRIQRRFITANSSEEISSDEDWLLNEVDKFKYRHLRHYFNADHALPPATTEEKKP